jgi:hypothetical protein
LLINYYWATRYALQIPTTSFARKTSRKEEQAVVQVERKKRKKKKWNIRTTKHKIMNEYTRKKEENRKKRSRKER